MTMLEPFLKWPGGKRWLVHRYEHLFPSEYRRYLEPFLGGGSVYFHLMPRKAILSDNNAELINAYRCLRESCDEIDRRLTRLHRRHNAALYYRMREERPIDRIDRAVRFIYLNRTCFNGIYRVNLQGAFNVPMGSKDLVEYPKGFLKRIAAALRGAAIRLSDFEAIIDEASTGDFVYVDPPYTVMHNCNNFIKYNSPLFSWTDQIRLASAVKRAARRGALIMLSNANHDSVRELYGDFGFHHHVDRTSVLAAESHHRRKTSELVITNFARKG